jgi:hypothetical protein
MGLEDLYMRREIQIHYRKTTSPKIVRTHSKNACQGGEWAVRGLDGGSLEDAIAGSGGAGARIFSLGGREQQCTPAYAGIHSTSTPARWFSTRQGHDTTILHANKGGRGTRKGRG